ncbi:Auxin-responsive protein SAUR66-like protein [Drosera capensis]
MVSTGTLVRMVRKWQKLVVQSRRRISLPKPTTGSDEEPCTTSPRVKKGHFVVYSADKKRFVIPVAYLQNEIFIELLEAAEEQFGLQRDGPITLPCNSLLVEYALSLMQRDGAEDQKKAMTMSMANGQWMPSGQLPQELNNQHQILIRSF